MTTIHPDMPSAEAERFYPKDSYALPQDPVQLFELALQALEACAAAPEYRIDMRKSHSSPEDPLHWHWTDGQSGLISVNLAGCVMAWALDAGDALGKELFKARPKDTDTYRLKQQLYAVSVFQMGRLRQALGLLGIKISIQEAREMTAGLAFPEDDLKGLTASLEEVVDRIRASRTVRAWQQFRTWGRE